MKAKINETWDLEVPQDRADFYALRPNWERKRTEHMFQNINKGDVIIDIGTELGDFAAMYTTWGAKVVCVEPQPKYWPQIKQYFDLNKVKPLACFAGFASTKNEPNPPLADFELGYEGVWPLCALTPLEDWNGFRNVIETGISTPQLRLDQIVAENKVKQVDVITIDVEGAEFEVLKGAETVLSDYKPIVYVSVHPEMLQRDWGNSFDDICNFMKPLSYDWAFLDKDHEEHWCFFNTERGTLAEGVEL